jgi:adenylate cyclase
VNESARLSELAKRDPDRPLASGRTLEAAGRAESRRWEEAETLTLRGRSEDTVVFAARIPDADTATDA